MPETLSVLIADDHPIILDGVRLLLEPTKYKVVRRCQRGGDVIAALKEISPSLIILDNRMPGLTGLELIRLLRSQGRTIPIVLLTGSISDQETIEAIKLGVNGVVLKEKATNDLLSALDSVMEGDRWIDPDAMDIAAKAQSGPSALTERELQIARMVCSGLRNREIAEEASISEQTVKNHIHSLYNKLNVRSRTELMRYFDRSRRE